MWKARLGEFSSGPRAHTQWVSWSWCDSSLSFSEVLVANQKIIFTWAFHLGVVRRWQKWWPESTSPTTGEPSGKGDVGSDYVPWSQERSNLSLAGSLISLADEILLMWTASELKLPFLFFRERRRDSPALLSEPQTIPSAAVVLL